MPRTAAPSWLSGWVKLNGKHVAHGAVGTSAGKEVEDKCQQTASTARSPSEPGIVSSSTNRSARRNNWTRQYYAADKKTMPCTIVEASAGGGEREATLDEDVDDAHIHQRLQILNEAAFMVNVAETSSPAEEALLHPPSFSAARGTPEGLIVTTITAAEKKPRATRATPPQSYLDRFSSTFLAGAGGDRGRPCQSCLSLETKLGAAYDDLEYMRGVALQQHPPELYAATAATSSSPGPPHECEACGAYLRPVATPKPSAVAANELQELVQHHKEVVDALMGERARYQDSMQSKVDRYAFACQHLGQEVADRTQETKVLQEKLASTRWERDELAVENLRLKAHAVTHERQQLEHAELRRRYLDYEVNGIQCAVAATASRDAVINDLSSKLARVLDQLEAEREQHRQRRQIIFPPTPAPSPTVTAPKKS